MGSKNRLGQGKFPNKPTIGKSFDMVPERTNADATPDKVDPRDRAVAQPLPGKEVEPVKEDPKTTAEDRAKAMTEGSKTGKTYDKDDVEHIDPFEVPAQDDLLDASKSHSTVEPPASDNPLLLVDSGPMSPEELEARLAAAPGTNDIPEDEDLDAKDPLDLE